MLRSHQSITNTQKVFVFASGFKNHDFFFLGFSVDSHE
jgi:hypothetical protein